MFLKGEKQHMTEIHRIKCGNVNCYIAESESGGVLIDTAKKEYLDKVTEACRYYHVRLIVLTHAHFDHAENAAAISDRLGIPIVTHKNDVNLISSNMNQSLYAESFLGKMILSASLKNFSARPLPIFKPDIFLNDGDSLSDYGIDAKIVSLPGHTDGSIGIDVNRKHLIVGDALMNMFYPTVSMLYHNKKQMQESAEKIGSIGNRIICFGHGKPLPNRIWIK